MSVWSRRLADTPIAFLDFETTGFSPKTGCRVVEVAVVRQEPGGQPQLVLDTLVDPNGPVHATRIHGISEDDVLGAPLFCDVAPNVAAALEGAVVAAYNASFDVRFLQAEFSLSARTKVAWVPPHVCLMYMRPLLGLGPKCSLSDACAAFSLPSSTHRAADDAMAAARLWQAYLATPPGAALSLFDDFETGRYVFTDSFDNGPYTNELVRSMGSLLPTGALKPRDTRPFVEAPTLGESVHARRQYWHSVVDALSDGVFEDSELASLRALQQALQLRPEEVRAVHAKVAGEWLQAAAEDDAVSEREMEALRALFGVLRLLGWSPGDPV